MGEIKGHDHFFDDGKSYVDENGNRIDAYKNFWDDGVSYYKDGQKIGTSYKNFWDDGVSTYDNQGQKVSSTYKNFWDDGYSTYNNEGQKISSTYDNFWDDGTTTYTYGSSGSGLGAGYGGGYSGYSGYTGGYVGGYSGGYSGYHRPSPSVNPFTGRVLHRSNTARDNLLERTRKAWIVVGVLHILAAVYWLVSAIFPQLPFDVRIYYWGTGLLTALTCFLPGLSANLEPGYYVAGFAAAAVHALLVTASNGVGRGYWSRVPMTLGPCLRTACVSTVAGLLAGYVITLSLERKIYENVKPGDDERRAKPVALVFMLAQLLLLWTLLRFHFSIAVFKILAVALIGAYAFFYGNMAGARPLPCVWCGSFFAILHFFGFLANGGRSWDELKRYAFDVCGPVYLLISAAVIFFALIAGGTKKDGFGTLIGTMWIFAVLSGALPLFFYRFGFLRERTPVFCFYACLAFLAVLHLSVNLFYKEYRFRRTLLAFAIGMACLLLIFVRFERYGIGLTAYFLGKAFLLRVGMLAAVLILTAIPSMTRKATKKDK